MCIAGRCGRRGIGSTDIGSIVIGVFVRISGEDALWRYWRQMDFIGDSVRTQKRKYVSPYFTVLILNVHSPEI